MAAPIVAVGGKSRGGGTGPAEIKGRKGIHSRGAAGKRARPGTIGGGVIGGRAARGARERATRKAEPAATLSATRRKQARCGASNRRWSPGGARPPGGGTEGSPFEGCGDGRVLNGKKTRGPMERDPTVRIFNLRIWDNWACVLRGTGGQGPYFRRPLSQGARERF